MGQKQTDGIEFKRPEYLATEDQVILCNLVYNGVDTARSLLEKTPNEQTQDFLIRQKKASLNNYIERIVTTMSGQLFRKPVTYADIPIATVENYLENTNKNIHFNQFGKEVAESAILNGKAYIMVDIPTDGGDPYFSLVSRPQLINWRKDEEGNFTMAVIAEGYLDETGEFSVEIKKQYRHIKANGDIDIYRAGDTKDTWDIETITTSYNFVPLYEVDISNVPLLYDIAVMNVNYFNSFSKKDQYLDTAGSPIPFGKGLGLSGANDIFTPDEDVETPAIILGVNSVVLTENVEASLEWVEMTGGSIEALQDDLDRKARAMTEQALKVMSESTKTATQSASEKEESASRLSDIAEELEVGLNKAYNAWHRLKYNKDAKGTISVNRDFNLFAMDSGLLSGLTALQVSGNLSTETLLRSLVKHEIVDIEDVDIELKRIADGMDPGEPDDNDGL